VLKDLKKFGYDCCPQTLSRLSEYPLPNFEEEFNKNTDQMPLVSLVQETENEPKPQETMIPQEEVQPSQTIDEEDVEEEID
jgi:hypothetical protein